MVQRITVIGAGSTGHSAAAYLTQRGFTVTSHDDSRFSSRFEDISRLTFEHLAQHVERAETDGPDFSCLDAREIDVGDSHLVSKLVQRDMPIRHDLVKMKNDWHRTHLQGFVRESL